MLGSFFSFTISNQGKTKGRSIWF